jgi:murein L,D-transpeptidase YcbB/YkuD
VFGRSRWSIGFGDQVAPETAVKRKLQFGNWLFPFWVIAGLLAWTAGRAVAQSALPVSEQSTFAQQIAKAQGELGPLPEFRGQIAKFYAAMGDQPAWVVDGRLTRQGLALVGLFEHAGEKGLRPKDYGDWTAMLAELSTAKTEQQRMGVDVAVTAAAMRYVSDLHFGRVEPQAMGYALGAREKNFSLAEFLVAKVVHAGDVEKAIAAAEPPFSGYWRALAALARLERVAKETRFEQLPVPRKSVHPGERYAALPQLVTELRSLGDLPPKATLPKDNTEYQGAVVEAVKRFQGRHGLTVDGVLGRATLAAVNVPLSDRIEQLELTLERWRWIPQHLVLPVVVVNIPEFRLYVIDRNYDWLMQQKVIIGRSYQHKTPVFIAQMQSVIFRPYWNVPLSIQRKELLPKIARDHGYLQRNEYEIVNRANRPVGDGINGEVLGELRSGALKIRQMPGDKNALGLIKFEFPNRYDVYMHGTPAKELFSRTRRDFSHGCIRVEHPAALAEWVLRGLPGWTPEKIDAAMHGNQRLEVKLPEPLTVVIFYSTVVVTHYAEMRFLPDIYGYDAKLKRALARRRAAITARP